ncbi:MAG: acyltransferase [Candidatus Omnitrophica bacterium]|nr:acyltransferase [Candidatus Omnitrophota bacterium]
MSQAATLYPKTYYPYLDGFRALSILWVLLHHIYVFFDLRALAAAQWLPALLAAKLGLLGVDMFFVISGFLITGLLIQDLDKDVRVRRFYLRRIFKIIPSYVAALLGGLLMLAWIGDTPLIDYGNFRIIDGQVQAYQELVPRPFSGRVLAGYFVFLQNFSEHIATLAHTWSIAIEEHFYLGYPLLFWLAVRAGKNFSVRRRWLLALLLGFFLLAHVYRYVSIVHFHALNNQATPARIDALIFGCLIRIAEPWLKTRTRRVQQWLGPLCLLAGVGIYASLFMLTYQFIEQDSKTISGGLYYYAAIYLAPGLLILSALLNYQPLVKILSRPSLISIGKHSYGTYLWHYILIFPFALWQDRFSTGALIALYVPCALLAGYLSTNTVERFFLNMRRKYCP